MSRIGLIFGTIFQVQSLMCNAQFQINIKYWSSFNQIKKINFIVTNLYGEHFFSRVNINCPHENRELNSILPQKKDNSKQPSLASCHNHNHELYELLFVRIYLLDLVIIMENCQNLL